MSLASSSLSDFADNYEIALNEIIAAECSDWKMSARPYGAFARGGVRQARRRTR